MSIPAWDPSDPRHVLEARVTAHLEQIEDDSRYLEMTAATLGGAGFTAAWMRQGSATQGRDLRALERSFEQIVNDLQEMFDSVERVAHGLGVVPDPQPIAGDIPGAAATNQWWAEAGAIGLDISSSNTSQAPGRWRRLALYGDIEHDLATALLPCMHTRQLFQHGYAHRTEERAAEVWALVERLRGRLPEALEGLTRFHSRVRAF